MNFHSMMVHFPIALLIIYSLFELIRFKVITRHENWFYIKATFLIVGVLTAFPALSTGGMLEDLPKYDRQLVHLHESFASASTNFYGIVAIVYVLALTYRIPKVRDFILSIKSIPGNYIKIIVEICRRCYKIVSNPLFILIPIIGIVLLSITGGLGGVLSSGIGVDPIADYFYYLFF